MKTFTAIAAATALLASAGIASANSPLPLNPNKSSQASPLLEGLIGTQVAAGVIVSAVLVGSVIVVSIAAEDGTITTSTIATP